MLFRSDAQYYWDGTIGPVRFHEAVSGLVARHRGATFVEIGPHPALASYLTDRGSGSSVTCPLRRPRASESGLAGIEVHAFVSALGKIAAAGHNCVDFDALYGGANVVDGKRIRTKTPPYPFAPKSIPWFVQTPEIARQRQTRNGPMNFPQLAINARTHPGLADHAIQGEPIRPAAGYVEMVRQVFSS